MPNWLLALLIGGGIGLAVSPIIRRGSVRREALVGGAAAQLLHGLACVLQSAATPVGFAAALLLRDDPPLSRLVIGTVLALGCSLAGLLVLLPFGLIESLTVRRRADQIALPEIPQDGN